MNKDRLTPARRSWNMSRIRSKDTAPEKIVRSLLHRLGFRFRLHVRIPLLTKDGPKFSLSPRERAGVRGKGASEFPGASTRAVERKEIRNSAPRTRQSTLQPRSVSVDILLPKYKTVIFVHGCFWHRHKGCKNCTSPRSATSIVRQALNQSCLREKSRENGCNRPMSPAD